MNGNKTKQENKERQKPANYSNSKDVDIPGIQSDKSCTFCATKWWQVKNWSTTIWMIVASAGLHSYIFIIWLRVGTRSQPFSSIGEDVSDFGTGPFPVATTYTPTTYTRHYVAAQRATQQFEFLTWGKSPFAWLRALAFLFTVRYINLIAKRKYYF